MSEQTPIGNDQRSDPPRRWQEILTSDYVLGTLVVLFTIATALAAYLGSLTDLRTENLNNEAQDALILGTTTFLQLSVELSEELMSYQSYQLLKDRDPEAAALILEGVPVEKQEIITAESNPFSDAYREGVYQEAFILFDDVNALQDEADQASMLSERFERALFILAIGLALTAWAAIYDDHPHLKLVFTILALPCLLFGMGILLSSILLTI